MRIWREDEIVFRSKRPREIIDRNHNPFSAAGVHPYAVPSSPWTGQPKHYFYPYQNVRSALDVIRSTSFDPFEGVAVRLTDPATGGPALPTMDFTVHLVPAGMQTLPQRRSSHSICLCLEGAGQITSVATDIRVGSR